MKGGGIFVIIILGVLGYLAWTQLGGDITGTPPDVGRPEIQLPDANEAGDAASDAAGNAADEVGSWSINTWKMILIGLGALGLSILWFRNPKFKYGVIGALIMVIVVVGFL